MKLKELNKGIDGIEFLRNLVEAFDYRNENLNSNKTPSQLVNEYLRYRNFEIDLNGKKTIKL